MLQASLFFAAQIFVWDVGSLIGPALTSACFALFVGVLHSFALAKHSLNARRRPAPQRSVRRVYEHFSSDSAYDFGLMTIIYDFLHNI